MSNARFGASSRNCRSSVQRLRLIASDADQPVARLMRASSFALRPSMGIIFMNTSTACLSIELRECRHEDRIIDQGIESVQLTFFLDTGRNVFSHTVSALFLVLRRFPAYYPPVRAGCPATAIREPRQARKGAAAAVTPGAGDELARAPSLAPREALCVPAGSRYTDSFPAAAIADVIS